MIAIIAYCDNYLQELKKTKIRVPSIRMSGTRAQICSRQLQNMKQGPLLTPAAMLGRVLFVSWKMFCSEIIWFVVF
jgi:hypothetical protein